MCDEFFLVVLFVLFVVPWFSGYFSGKEHWDYRNISTFHFLLHTIFCLWELNLMWVPMMSWRHFNVWVWFQLFLLCVPCVEEHSVAFWFQAGRKLFIRSGDCHRLFVMVWTVLDVSSKMSTLVGIDEHIFHVRNLQSLIKYQDIIAPVWRSISSRRWYDWDVFHWDILIRKWCYVATHIGISQYCTVFPAIVVSA